MTTIAYKDGIMASDSQVSTGGGMRVGHAKKVFKSDTGAICGHSGALSDIRLISKWFANSPDFDKMPERKGSTDGIIVTPDRQIFYYDKNGNPFEVNAEIAAVGAGEEMALAAMLAGASAEDAVRIAISLNVDSGGPVQVVTLDETE